MRGLDGALLPNKTKHGLCAPLGSIYRASNLCNKLTKFPLLLSHLLSVPPLSRTHKLLTQITQVCQEIRDIKVYSSTKKNHRSKKPPQDKGGRDGTDYTHSKGNMKHAHYEDLYNNPGNQRRHETSSLPGPLPPSSPSPMSSHSSSEASVRATLPLTLLVS